MTGPSHSNVVRRRLTVDGSPIDDLRAGLSQVADRFRALHDEALRTYTPLVEQLLTTDCRDPGTIERTLDGLLDFCGDERVLGLYRRLCRHYWSVDPEATAQYIRFYRDAYDSETNLG
jgi:hypothetical protein